MGKSMLSSSSTSIALMVVFVCTCVLLQMLGTPVTLIDVLTSELPGESLSEDFSIPPVIPEIDLITRTFPHEHPESSRHLPVLMTWVFHPPYV